MKKKKNTFLIAILLIAAASLAFLVFKPFMGASESVDYDCAHTRFAALDIDKSGDLDMTELSMFLDKGVDLKILDINGDDILSRGEYLIGIEETSLSISC